MEAFLFVCILVVLAICWIYLRNRIDALENRLGELERAAGRRAFAAQVVPPAPIPTPPPESISAPAPPPPAVERPAPPPAAFPPPLEPVAAPVRRTSEEWEALIGGNWVNKIGVFVAVIGIALLLNYAYTQLGAAGRVALSLGAAFAMLVSGVVFERREKYRTFSYGLIGGGWAALYTTVYAMYSIPAAKVLDNAFAATLLLLAVAAGMIVHSLKYRSQTVTGLAYFLAFVSLAIAEITTFSVLMLVPLSASLLYIAYRNQWNRFAIFGLVATYLTCGLHKDTGSPLWQTQALFLLYWLIFEGFDLLRADPWLLPLNALGFLALSAGKWTLAAPNDIWQLAAGAAALYLAGTIVRARAGRWKCAVLFNAALAATAIVLKLHDQWLPLGLLIEAELYYLAGVRFRSTFLRTLAGAIFVLQVGDLLIEVIVGLPPRSWEPVAALDVAVFYLNRALETSEVWYGYAAVAMAALISGFEANGPWRGRLWSLMALAPFSLGWWRRLRDFRVQGYALASAGAVATAIYLPHPPLSLAVGAAVAYAFVHVTLWSGEDRFGPREREVLRLAASCVTTLGLCNLLWRLVPSQYLGIAWLALALALLEAGLRKLPDEFRWLALLVGILGVSRVAGFDLSSRLALVSSALTYTFALRARKEADGRVLATATWPATLFLLAGLYALLPAWAVSSAWALAALALAEFPRRSLRAQAILVSALVATRCLAIDLGTARPILAIAPTIVCFWAAMLRRQLGGLHRMYDSLLTTLLLGALIFHEVGGSVLTVAWGVEAVALLAGGFALRDRVLRLSGLALFLICTLKLFFWDLRNLETLPRIVGFIVLGLLLVAVSWVYTRFRDQVQRFL
ncbi:MAG: DUF2339 domain-containing protein [Candidatus Solibacter sp.]|jgi:uncharacterized membrane protein